MKHLAPRVRESMYDMSVCKYNPCNYWELTTVESVILILIWALFIDKLTGMLFTWLTPLLTMVNRSAIWPFHVSCIPFGRGWKWVYFLKWFAYKGGQVIINKNCDARTPFQKHSTKKWGITMHMLDILARTLLVYIVVWAHFYIIILFSSYLFLLFTLVMHRWSYIHLTCVT